MVRMFFRDETYSPKNPKFWGWGWGETSKWGIFLTKTKKNPKFQGEVWARALKRFGDNLGTGQSQLSGNFGGKIPKFRSGDGG